MVRRTRLRRLRTALCRCSPPHFFDHAEERHRINETGIVDPVHISPPVHFRQATHDGIAPWRPRHSSLSRKIHGTTSVRKRSDIVLSLRDRGNSSFPRCRVGTACGPGLRRANARLQRCLYSYYSPTVYQIPPQSALQRPPQTTGRTWLIEARATGTQCAFGFAVG